MNNYPSVLRAMRARNIYEATISPPNDFTIPGASMSDQILNRHRNWISPNTNVMIKSMGIFCNFADGLVQAVPAESIHANIDVFAGLRGGGGAVQTGSTLSHTSRDITVADTTDFSFGDYVLIHPDGNRASQKTTYNRVLQVVNAATLRLFDYPLYDYTASATVVRIDLISSFNTNFLVPVRELNFLYPWDVFITPTLYTAIPVNEVIYEVVFDENQDITWLTKSISTDFDEDNIMFDALAEFVYTERTDAEKAA